MRRRFLAISAGSLVSAGLLAIACGDEDTNPSTPNEAGVIGIDVGSGTGSDAASDRNVPVDSATSDSSAPSDAGSDAADSGADADAADAATCPRGLTFADGGVMLVPSPYADAIDSPFCSIAFATYFHRATFEGDSGLPTGVTSAFGSPYPAVGTHASNTDSVDGDDGYPDGSAPDAAAAHPCFGCRSFFNGAGTQGVDFTFDEAALGGLPTHAGLVWTDGAGNVTVTFTAYGADGGVIDTQVVTNIGDSSNFGETAEDRFFGAVAPAGIKRLTLKHTSGGLEVDHLQFGR